MSGAREILDNFERAAERQGDTSRCKRKWAPALLATAGLAIVGSASVLARHGLASSSRDRARQNEEINLNSFCDTYPYLRFELPHAVQYNNLANKGPDKGQGEGIVYYTVDMGAGAGDELDKEVIMTVNATSNGYHPFSSRLNGMQGKYGSLNLNSGSSVDLEFKFYDSESGDPLDMKEYAMTWFDLDTGAHGTSTEFVEAEGFKEYHLMDETEVKVKKIGDMTRFSASTMGTGEDNPKDPMFLTAQQKNRAVTLLFENIKSVKVTIGAGEGSGPRFFTFVGRPSLLCAVTVQEGFKPPLPDIIADPPMQLGVEGTSDETFVGYHVKKGQEVKKGDPVVTVKSKDGKEVTYKATGDGKIIEIQDKLVPNDDLDMRLDDKTMAVIQKPYLEPLKLEDGVMEGGPGKHNGIHKHSKFDKYLVKVGDKVAEGDPIAVFLDSRGHEHVMKATASGAVRQRQDDLQKGDPVMKVEDLNLISVGPFPALGPISDNNVKAAVVDSPEGKTFQEYKVKVGEIVKAGDVVAVVKDSEGNEQPVKATHGGIITGRQDLSPGMPLAQVEDANLATAGKFQPLPTKSPRDTPVLISQVNSPPKFEHPVGDARKAEETEGADGEPKEESGGDKSGDSGGDKSGDSGEGKSGESEGSGEGKTKPEDGGNPGGTGTSESGEKEGEFVKEGADEAPVDEMALTFVKYKAKVGDQVEDGDPIAVVKDKDGKEHTLVAPHPGVVTALQDNLQEGHLLGKVLAEGDLAVVAPLPAVKREPYEKSVKAPKEGSWKLEQWRAEVGDEVKKDTIIATLKNEETGQLLDVPAGKSGIMSSRRDELEKGDSIEKSTVDDELASIGRFKEPEEGFREMGVAVPDMDATFDFWEVKSGDRVHQGDPIAQVTLPTRRLVEADGTVRRLAGQSYQIPSPGTGWVSFEADLQPGESIRNQSVGPTIAKVDLGLPWWLALFGCVAVLCCCLGGLFKLMQKPEPLYRPLKEVTEAEPEPPAPVPEQKSEPPPPRVEEKKPAPPPEPEGVRLDFLANGERRTVYCRYKPLGIKHNDQAPIVAHDFTVCSYAKQELGVRDGWKLVRIGKEELNENPNFEDVHKKLDAQMHDLPLWPLPLEFQTDINDPSTRHVKKFWERPLGLEFNNQAPIQVGKIYDDSPAHRHGVVVGWYLTKIGDFDVHENHNFREVMKHFKEGVAALNDAGRSYDKQ